MKKFGVFAGCALVAAAWGVTLLAQNYAHPWLRDGVTKVFENDRVAIWEVNWKHGVQQPIHEHPYDYAGSYLRYGPITVTTPDGKMSPPPGTPRKPYTVPRPYFGKGGTTHKEEGTGNPGDPEQLAIMVDLKQYSPVYPQPTSRVAPAFPREGAQQTIVNERVAEWDYTWVAGKPAGPHFHDKDAVEIFFEGGTIRYKMADGREETKTWKFKDARFVPGGHVDTEEVVSGSPRAAIIELKPRSTATDSK